jgi:hypothetical protein
MACRNLLQPWVFMWVLSLAIYLSLKWLTWWRVRSRIDHPAWRSVGYLFAWPGMDADTFLNARQRAPAPAVSKWLWAALETTLGAVLLWAIARFIPPANLLMRGWLGMVGLILILHFGLFQIVALLWQGFGVAAEPIMRSPLRSTSRWRVLGKAVEPRFSSACTRVDFSPDIARVRYRHGWISSLPSFWTDP